MEWKIGEQAKKMDEKSIKERMKIERSSLKKILGALVIYFVVMGIFALIL